MFDLIIRHSRVIDGTGAESFTADVGIVGDMITAVGDLSGAESHDTIDLGASPPALHSPQSDGGTSDLILCPGFIDAHTHSDTYLLIEPSAPSKVYQGITTEVCGNCGASGAPISDISQLPSDWADKRYPGAWSSVAEFRDLFDHVRPAVNAVLLIGHNTLRRNVVGYDNRPATPNEMDRMLGLMEESMAAGGRGLTTGLVYAPGMYASRAEIVALAKVAGRHDGIYGSHMRSEGAQLIEAIDETIEIGEAAGSRIQVSHLKAAGQDNWHKMDAALERIRTARERGVPVLSDRYPYTAGATDLDVVFPAWFAEGGRAVILARLKDSEARARLRDELLASRPTEAWGGVTVGSTSHPDNRRFRGMNLLAVGEALGCDPVDAILHLCESDELMTGAFFAGMSEANMFRVLAEPYVMLGSDASLRSPTGPLSHDYPHPRAYGSFPRFLRWALDGRTVALPEAVRKMTSLPAGQFGLHDRGVIAERKKADLVVFDAARVRDRADYGDPHQLSEGITHLVVNGVVTIRDGKLTGTRGGRLV
ncbi:MAG: D-aminoacylase [Verrucomicrobia bacterium]|jgi:N-acyl-D-amino-acid deacylase|nr:D-aminoacylase [Verrucomicrobiota bacterium]MBT7067921.1 D-aminoacylase [Verrucomicrobiota bacterium]MBT7700527.1 D-aminoacylase [Verrucomicrobiota bacterium]